MGRAEGGRIGRPGAVGASADHDPHPDAGFVEGPDNEPSTYSLPLIENSLASLTPVCDSSAPQDFYTSNKITAAQLSEYGKP